MSGDFGPHVTIPAALSFLRRHPDVALLLVGNEMDIMPRLDLDAHAGRLRVVHVPLVIGMDEKPSHALRHGQQSSLYRAVELVASGEADAAVSAGNTGAMMAIGRYLLQTHPGIDRPAIATRIPAKDGDCIMLDLGANVDCSAEHLYQFALLGSALREALMPGRKPRIGLLNVGKEAIKGNEQVKLADRLIRENGALHYVGYVEGDDIFASVADVVVCDGFVGNVALKSSEGLARMLGSRIRESFSRSLRNRLAAWLAGPMVRELQSLLDPARHNGASLLGLRGVLVKSHGGADARCFAHALEQALRETRQKVPEQTSRVLAGLL